MNESVERVVEVLSGLDGNVSSWALHLEAESALKDAGYVVSREFRVPARGDGRRGKIDLVVWRESEDERIAIELDHRSPRKKSLFKLRAFPGLRVMVLRHEAGGRWPETPRGIDAVVGLNGESGYIRRK